MHMSFKALALALLALAPIAAQAEENTFVTQQKHRKPGFKDGDEQVVRDFAKAHGQEFSAGMELPSCQLRMRLRTPGGYMDASGIDWGYGAYLRIPVPESDTRLANLRRLDPVNPAATYRSPFPTAAYLEIEGHLDNIKGTMSWPRAAIVLPPMRMAGGRANPGFEVASASLSGYRFPDTRIDEIPDLPTFVELPDFHRAIEKWDGKGALTVTVQQIAPEGDPRAPRVQLEASFPSLAEDLRRVEPELLALKARDKAGKCKVYSSECRDGDCR